MPLLAHVVRDMQNNLISGLDIIESIPHKVLKPYMSNLVCKSPDLLPGADDGYF